MTLQEFYEAFESLLRMALTSGLQAADRPDVHPREYSTAEWKQFIAGCHRGYSKAQSYMVRLAEKIERSASLSEAEKRRCTFLVRGVAETIALAILGEYGYMIRRLSLSYEPTSLNFATLRMALVEAEKMNSESRQTFALLTDLTLSIQVADVLRVDFRKRGRKYKLIELKAGRVNAQLESVLIGYPASDAGIEQVDTDAAIDPKYRKQAKRMLRQRIRMAQVEEISTTDGGTDIQHKRPIRISPTAIELEDYDDVIGDLLDIAVSSGLAADAVDEAIAIACAIGDAKAAEPIALRALGQQLGKLDAVVRLAAPEIASEVKEALDGEPPFFTANLFESVLGRVAVRPPSTWAITKAHLNLLVRREATLLSGLHLGAFLHLARSVGVEIRFSSRREAERFKQEVGHREIPRWNGRALIRKGPDDREGPVTGGLLGRFLFNLTRPRSFLSQMRVQEQEMSAVEDADRDSE